MSVERPKQFTNAGLARLGQVIREARQRIGRLMYGDSDLSQDRFVQYVHEKLGVNLITKQTLSRLENGWLKTPQADTIQYLAPFTWNEEKQRPWLWYELIELAMDEIPTENANGSSRG